MYFKQQNCSCINGYQINQSLDIHFLSFVKTLLLSINSSSNYRYFQSCRSTRSSQFMYEFAYFHTGLCLNILPVISIYSCNFLLAFYYSVSFLSSFYCFLFSPSVCQSSQPLNQKSSKPFRLIYSQKWRSLSLRLSSQVLGLGVLVGGEQNILLASQYFLSSPWQRTLQASCTQVNWKCPVGLRSGCNFFASFIYDFLIVRFEASFWTSRILQQSFQRLMCLNSGLAWPLKFLKKNLRDRLQMYIHKLSGNLIFYLIFRTLQSSLAYLRLNLSFYRILPILQKFGQSIYSFFQIMEINHSQELPTQPHCLSNLPHLNDFSRLKCSERMFDKALVSSLQQELRQLYGFQISKASLPVLSLYFQYFSLLKYVITDRQNNRYKHNPFLTEYSKNHSQEKVSKLLLEIYNKNNEFKKGTIIYRQECLLNYFGANQLTQEKLIPLLVEKISKAKNSGFIKFQVKRSKKRDKTFFPMIDKENTIRKYEYYSSIQSRKNLTDRQNKVYYEILALRMMLKDQNPDPLQTNKLCEEIKHHLQNLFNTIKIKNVPNPYQLQKRNTSLPKLE